jgi:hypothetical protein
MKAHKIMISVRLHDYDSWSLIQLDPRPHLIEVARAIVDGMVAQGYEAHATIETSSEEIYTGPPELADDSEYRGADADSRTVSTEGPVREIQTIELPEEGGDENQTKA